MCERGVARRVIDGKFVKEGEVAGDRDVLMRRERKERASESLIYLSLLARPHAIYVAS